MVKAGAESERRSRSVRPDAKRSEECDDVRFEFASVFLVDDQHRVVELVLRLPSVKKYVTPLDVGQKIGPRRRRRRSIQEHIPKIVTKGLVEILKMISFLLVVASSSSLLCEALRVGGGEATTTTLNRRAMVVTSLLTASSASAKTNDIIGNEFSLADLDRNGKLTKAEFDTWYKGNELLTGSDSGALDSLSLPEIAFDLTGLLGFLVGIYAVSYAYYISVQAAAAEATAKKKEARLSKASPKDD